MPVTRSRWLVLPVRLAALLAVATPAVPSQAAAKCQYAVKQGDTVSRIARKHGISEKQLVAANPALKKNPDRLRIGQSLEICRAKQMAAAKPQKCEGGGRIVSHTVGPGETLGGIAAHYAVSRGSLPRYNKSLKSRSNNVIRVGETLRVCTTLRRYTHRSWFRDGVQLPTGDGYNVRRPGNAWGTTATIAAILGSIARYRDLEPEAPLVQVGDISRHNGGPLRQHVSHQEGRDVDIGYVFEEDEAGDKHMDMSRTWSLVRTFAEDENVAVIFMDYALQKRLFDYAASVGTDETELRRLFEYPRDDEDAVFYHWPGHARHFHVRFGKAPAEPREGEGEDASPSIVDPAEAGAPDPKS